MIIMKLISLQSAVWVVSSATTLITQLLSRYEETDSTDLQTRSLLAQCIQILRVFSGFISSEQLNEINEHPIPNIDIQELTPLDILSNVALQTSMEDNL